MTGGEDNDYYFVDNSGDTVTESSAAGDGIDTVNSSLANYTLAANVENLTLFTFNSTSIIDLNLNGSGNSLNNNITGNKGSNTLHGDDGNDYLNGGSGIDALYGDTGNDSLNGGTAADSLVGGIGNDYYFVDDSGDAVTEQTGEGTDTVNSSSSTGYTLAANVENLTLSTGTVDLNGTGNNDNNVITGNNGNNSLNGAEGNDYLKGGIGNDTLDGGSGNDILSGGSGNDTFKLMDSLSIDTITDFYAAKDKIQLATAGFSALNNFSINNLGTVTGAATGSDADDYFIYNSDTGALYYDADATNGGAAVKIAMIGTDLDLTIDNFLVA